MVHVMLDNKKMGKKKELEYIIFAQEKFMEVNDIKINFTVKVSIYMIIMTFTVVSFK